MSAILIWPFRQVFRLLAPIKAAWNEELSKHYFGLADNYPFNDDLRPPEAYVAWRDAFADLAQEERTRVYNERQSLRLGAAE